MTEIIPTNHNLSDITESLDPNGVTGHDPLDLTKDSASWLQNIFDTSSQMGGNLPSGLGAVANHLSHNISIFEFAVAGSQHGAAGLAAQTVDYTVDIVATDFLIPVGLGVAKVFGGGVIIRVRVTLKCRRRMNYI